MRIVGLTGEGLRLGTGEVKPEELSDNQPLFAGGIATGKSTVSNHLRAAGLPVVDFDVIAREVCQKVWVKALLAPPGP